MGRKFKEYSSIAISSLILTACGGGESGNSGATIPVPITDTSSPTISFSPDSLTVSAGQTGESTLTASDNVGITSGPTVTCTEEGSFSGSTYTAPSLGNTARDRTSVCTATASDAAGNSTTATLTVTIPMAFEVRFFSSVVSDKSVVSEGQPFTLDGSASTINTGETLLFDYVQTGGTPVTISDPSNAIQNLIAPNISADETLTFEVTVSHDTGLSRGPISIRVEDFQPVETVSNITPFNADNSLPFIRGMTASDDGSYTLYWGSDSISSPSPISSQAFTGDGVRSGGQIDGEFQAANNQVVGGTADVIENGDTLYYLNVFLDSANMLGVTSHRGVVNGSVFNFGDEFQTPINRITSAADTVPFGTNRLVNITTGDIAGASHFATSYIIEPDGTSIETVLAGPSDNNDIDGGTIAVFGDNNYVGIWAEENVDGSGFGIRLQRVASGGTLLGSPVTVNEKTEFDQLSPNAATLQDGNVFITWSDTDGAQGGNSIKGRVVRPDGTFATEEFSITFRDNQQEVPIGPHVTALTTNQVLVSWRVGVPTSNEIEAQAFNTDGTTASNLFSIQSFDPNAPDQSARDVVTLNSVTLPDNRVILGWSNQTPSPGLSHTVGFYPVGRE